MKRRWLPLLLAAALLCALLGGCSKDTAVKLDRNNPVTISIWHYYNGAQKTAFDQLVTEFNETVGLESGIIVEAYNQGNVNQLIESVVASAGNKVGTEPIPDIFAGYADTVYQIDQMGLVVDLKPYFTDEELATYLAAYIDEGYLGADDQLKILPTAKSTEVFMLNKTDWDLFAAATGADISQLSTYEGIAEVAAAYYNWTDAQTPDVPNDGRAFFGRDAMANYLIIGCRQFGKEIFSVQGGEVSFELDRNVLRKLWDNYYVPYISGYFAANGKFRSDDAKVGDIIALIGSSSSATYFPSEVIVNDQDSYAIEALVLPVPVFQDGTKVAVQQGAGMAVTKSTPEREYAASIFLKWFTDTQRNLEFSILSGYLPVKKEANDAARLQTAMDAQPDMEFSEILRQTLTVSLETTSTYELYTNRAFKNGTAARNVLETALSDRATADRAEVVALLEAGVSLEDAVAQYNTDENFSAWFDSLQTALEDTQKGS